MNFYIAARKDTKAELEKGANSLNLSDATVRGKFRAALCSNKSIDDSNLELYYVDVSDAGAQSVMDGGDYNLTWSGDAITGIDITPETSKRLLKATASKSEIIADGVDETIVTLEVWLADGSAIDTSVNITTDIPIETPDGVRKVKATFSNGVVSRNFKTKKAGLWCFPARMKRYKTVRVDSVVEVDAQIDFANL